MHYESLSEELSERSLLDLLLFLDFFSFLLFFLESFFLESFFLESFFAFFEERRIRRRRGVASRGRPGVARGPTRHPPEPQPAAYPRGTRSPPSQSRVPADRGTSPSVWAAAGGRSPRRCHRRWL